MRFHRVSMFLVHGDETLESSEREAASVYVQCVYASALTGQLDVSHSAG